MDARDADSTAGVTRTLRALSGARLVPPARGLTFIPPDAVGGARGRDPDVALAAAADEAGVDFVFVPSWEPWAGRLVMRLRSVGVASLWVARGVLWPTLERVGVLEGLAATARDPGSLAAALDEASEAMLESVALGMGLRADVLVVADDLAGEGGPIVAPDFVNDAVMPRLAQAVASAARAGMPSVMHSDGRTGAFITGMRAAGFAGLHAGGVPIEELGRLHVAARSAGLALIGGIPVRDLGSPHKAVRAGTRAAILAETGGVLIADDGGVASREEYVLLLAALAAADPRHGRDDSDEHIL